MEHLACMVYQVSALLSYICSSFMLPCFRIMYTCIVHIQNVSYTVVSHLFNHLIVSQV